DSRRTPTNGTAAGLIVMRVKYTVRRDDCGSCSRRLSFVSTGGCVLPRQPQARVGLAGDGASRKKVSDTFWRLRFKRCLTHSFTVRQASAARLDFHKGLLMAVAVAMPLGLPSLMDAQPSSRTVTRLITLGTRSGPFPTSVRAQASNALIVGERVYVIDAGDGVARRLAKAGVPIGNIEAIFLTHLHDDHTSGLVPLLSVEYQLDRSATVGIYGPPLTEALAAAAVQFLTINSDIRMSDGTRSRSIGTIIAGHDAEPGVVYRDSNITVRA